MTHSPVIPGNLIVLALILGACTPATSTVTAPLPTPTPFSSGGLNPSELKYRLLVEFTDFFFCDPDYYPLARADEADLARQAFLDIQASTEEFEAILAHTGLSGLTTFTDDQILQIYREHKKLNALQLIPASAGYQFTLQVAETEGKGELITGLIDPQGILTIQSRTASIAACPICLAFGTLIDTPSGPIPVQDLQHGNLVWTLDQFDVRIAQPILRLTKTIVPANHQVVHLLLDDGRELWVSPGHPTPSGLPVGQLQLGSLYDGAVILSANLIPYLYLATYDLLPAGSTGYYWANHILLASTIYPPEFSQTFPLETKQSRLESGTILP